MSSAALFASPRSLSLASAAVLTLLGAACTGAIGSHGDPIPPIGGGAGSGSGSGPPGGGNANPGGGPNPPGGAMTPGGPGTPPAAMGCAAPPRRIWKLTPDQYGRAVAAVVPGIMRAGDGIAASLADAAGFSNAADALAMTGPHVTQLLKTAWQIGSDLAAAPDKLLPCLPAGVKDAACLRELVTTYAPRAFRRDLGAGETDELVDFVSKQMQAGDLKAGLRQFFTYLFSSPQFLYRTELGEGAGATTLTPFERASALSFFLTDGPPDRALMEAARTGKLASADQVAAETRRLLADAPSATGLGKLFRETLLTQGVLVARKDAMVFPAWNEALAKDLAGEADAFVRHVLWQDGAKLSTLLTANYALANRALATFYGLDGAGLSGEHQKVAFPAGQRAGFATLAGFMAAKSDDDDTAPVRRGLFVRESLLCEQVPEPPATVNAVPPQPDGKRTQRERLATHSTDASCAGCHNLMDPLGLAFERYDGIGRYRTMDVGKSIDVAGTVELGGSSRKFADAPELMAALAQAPEVSACFVRTAFRYAHGRPADAGNADKCALDRLNAAFGKSGGNLLELMVALTTDESFFARQ